MYKNGVGIFKNRLEKSRRNTVTEEIVKAMTEDDFKPLKGEKANFAVEP